MQDFTESGILLLYVDSSYDWRFGESSVLFQLCGNSIVYNLVIDLLDKVGQ